MNYDEAVAWLFSTQRFGIRLGLETMRRLCAALEVRVSGEGAPAFLHVAGTNGKGSVCAMLDAICRAAGYRTALYTSPHLVTFRERLRIGGEMISENEVATRLTALRDLVAGWEPRPTFFEITTALALRWFQDERAEVVVLETGLGGRLDATNVVTPAVSVITRIDLDHTQHLGATLARIAAEKAGIIKAGVPAVSAPQEESVERELRHAACAAGALGIFFVNDALADGEIALAGAHQRWNAALAVEALLLSGLARAAEPAAVRAGLRSVAWPGRFQRIGERVILDGAHNPAAAHQLATTWRGEFGEERATLILGLMRDKDLRGVCAALAPIAARVLAVPVPNERAAAPEEIIAALRDAGAACGGLVARDVATALVAAAQFSERVLVAGSLFLVGEALAHFAGLAIERSVQ